MSTIIAPEVFDLDIVIKKRNFQTDLFILNQNA